MHWIDRGTEPDGLADIRNRYTGRWVQHYQEGSGDAPNDDRWREYRSVLGQRFYDLCAYCEKPSRGEVDHFRPKSKFPELVYEWSNWLFSCHDCNSAKGDKWPDNGYVDPCAEDSERRPERYFDFDVSTGRIIPKSGLTGYDEDLANRMIDDLQLNEVHHVLTRLAIIRYISVGIENSLDDLSQESNRRLSRAAMRDRPFSSLVRAWLAERGRVFDDSGSSPPS